MKTFNFLSMSVMAVLLCANFAACGNDTYDPADFQKTKLCTVNINMESIVSVTEEPLGRAEVTTNNDLYLVYFYQQIDGKNEIYAHGLFNELDNITIQLTEGEKYYLNAVAVRNGKNKIYCDENGIYAAPFTAKLTNDFVYTNENSFNFTPATFYLTEGNGQEISKIALDFEAFLANGDINGYIASDGMSPISLSFFRLGACAVDFKAVDMAQGKLKINISAKDSENNTHISDDIILERPDESLIKIITFGEDLLNNIMSSQVNCTLNFTWIKDNGEEQLQPYNIAFKRDTKYKIEIKVDYTSIAGIQITPIGDGGFIDNNETTYITGQPMSSGN